MKFYFTFVKIKNEENMATSAELRQKGKEILKSMNLNRNDVSLSVRNGRYTTLVEFRVKNENVDLVALSEKAYSLEKVSYCESTGEILSGGNDFISVYDSKGMYFSL